MHFIRKSGFLTKKSVWIFCRNCLFRVSNLISDQNYKQCYYMKTIKKIAMILFFVNFTVLHSQNEEIYFSEIGTLEQLETKQQYIPKEIIVSKEYTLMYALAEYKSMIIRAKELTDKLSENNNRIQDGSITKTQIKKRKKDWVEAKLLNFRLDDYTSMYNKVNYPILEYLSIEVLNDYQGFSEIFTNSTQYAGF